MHSAKSSDTDIAYLSFNDLVLLLFMFLVTLRMLTDRVGCYNVREKLLYAIISVINFEKIDTGKRKNKSYKEGRNVLNEISISCILGQ